VLQSFVLRVVTGPLADGVVVGQLHDVASGHTSTFRNADELVEALRVHAELGPDSSETI
jgi:hypothetical protein